jgi:hypothetical protein
LAMVRQYELENVNASSRRPKGRSQFQLRVDAARRGRSRKQVQDRLVQPSPNYSLPWRASLACAGAALTESQGAISSPLRSTSCPFSQARLSAQPKTPTKNSGVLRCT